MQSLGTEVREFEGFDSLGGIPLSTELRLERREGWNIVQYVDPPSDRTYGLQKIGYYVENDGGMLGSGAMHIAYTGQDVTHDNFSRLIFTDRSEAQKTARVLIATRPWLDNNAAK